MAQLLREAEASIAAHPPVSPERSAHEQRATEALRNQRRIEIARVLGRRRREALNCYTPLPSLESFHRSSSHIRIIDGSNRSSKTTTALAEFARAVTGRDPHGKYPLRDGRALVVGYDLDHIANPIYEKLFRPGAIYVIRDEQTRKWRGLRVDPDNPKSLHPDDVARQSEWKPSAPFIPGRLISAIAWAEKKRNIPRKVILKNGWEILFRSSEGEPPQGIALDLMLIDEEIQNEEFYHDGIARLVDSYRKGKLIWSCTPLAGTPILFELKEKADAGAETIQRWTTNIDDNPYLTDEARQAFFDSLPEEERGTRYYGDYAIMGRQVYPNFLPMSHHGCEPFDIPEDYSRWLVVDPSTQYCGTTFVAIDPDELYAYIYASWTLRHTDSSAWADAVKRQVDFDGVALTGAICDQRYGRCHLDQRKSTAKPRAQIYYDALKERGVQPTHEGPLFGFYPGCDDVDLRTEALHGMMTVRDQPGAHGTCRLQIFRGKCNNLEKQIRRAVFTDKNPDKRLRGKSDELDCLEYFAAGGRGFPFWAEPKKAGDTEQDKFYERFLHITQGDRAQGRHVVL